MSKIDRTRGFRSAGFLALALLSVSAVVASAWWKHGAPNLHFPGESCAAWERAAGARVATLLEDKSALGERRLDEALFQLRRARKYCHAGYAAVAGSDYRALARAIPDVTTSIPKH